MTGASINFKAVKSAGHAVSHASREVAPTYLLPSEKSIGTVILLDDKGMVSQVLDAKMALASPRAKVDKRYSPVWEGILNLRRPEAGEDAEEYRAECSAVVTNWYKRYETSTGHKVLRVDVHLDEGHMVDGEAVLNAHAHVIADRTNDLGRVIKLSPKQLRELQTMTAEITQLERGKSSFETGRKHISHHAYKHLAERGRLETQQQVGEVKGELDKSQSDLTRQRKLSKEWSDADLSKVKNLKAEIDQLKAQYTIDRDALKATGEATQRAYQALKAAHDGALAELKKSNQKVVKMDEYSKKLEADLVIGEAKIAQVLIEKAEVIEALVKSGEKSDALLKTAIGHRDAAAKLTGELAEVKAKFATMATAYQAEKAKGTPAHLIEPTPKPAKTAIEAPKAITHPIAPPAPKKPLVELLAASWGAMVGWIKAIGAEQEPVGPSTRHDGPVKHLDDLHCVQKTGRRYAIHRLADLDNVPALDDPQMTIQYRDGKGTVKGRLGKPGVQI